MATKVAVVNQGDLTLFCTDWFHASMHIKDKDVTIVRREKFKSIQPSKLDKIFEYNIEIIE